MGTEAIWIPAVIAAVGAGASYYNTEQTAKRQDSELAAQIRAQGERRGEADALINQTLMKQQGSNAGEFQKSSMDQYLEQLQKTQGTAGSGLKLVGASSERFGTDAAAANQDINDYAVRTANTLSRIDAPALQRQEEGIAFGRLGGALDLVGAASDSDRFLADLKMRGIKRDPWLDAFSQAASSYASSPRSSGTGSTGGATGQTAFGYGSY